MEDKEKSADSAAKAQPSPSAPAGRKPPQAGGSRRGGAAKALRIGFWALLVVAAILIVRGCADDDSSDATTREAEIVSVEELADRAEDGGTIYWAGLQDGTELELSRPEEGRALVRYLPEGTEAGDPGTEFLTVGTYAYPDAATALRELGKDPEGVIASAPGGGVIFFSRQRPQSVYLAYPGSDLQIEVYDPDPKRALSLAAAGKIVPIG